MNNTMLSLRVSARKTDTVLQKIDITVSNLIYVKNVRKLISHYCVGSTEILFDS